MPRGIDEVNFAKLKGTPLSELSRAGQVMGKAMERPIISNIAKSPIKRGLVSLGSEFAMEGSEEMGQSVSDAVVRGEKNQCSQPSLRGACRRTLWRRAVLCGYSYRLRQKPGSKG